MTLDCLFKKIPKERFVVDDVSYCDNITGIKKPDENYFPES